MISINISLGVKEISFVKAAENTEFPVISLYPKVKFFYHNVEINAIINTWDTK